MLYIYCFLESILIDAIKVTVYEFK